MKSLVVPVFCLSLVACGGEGDSHSSNNQSNNDSIHTPPVVVPPVTEPEPPVAPAAKVDVKFNAIKIVDQKLQISWKASNRADSYTLYGIEDLKGRNGLEILKSGIAKDKTMIELPLTWDLWRYYRFKIEAVQAGKETSSDIAYQSVKDAAESASLFQSIESESSIDNFGESMFLSDTGKTLLVTNQDNAVIFYQKEKVSDTNFNKIQTIEPSKPVVADEFGHQIAATKDGKRFVASYQRDASLVSFEMEDGKYVEKQTISGKRAPGILTMSQDGQKLFSFEDKSIAVYQYQEDPSTKLSSWVKHQDILVKDFYTGDKALTVNAAGNLIAFTNRNHMEIEIYGLDSSSNEWKSVQQLPKENSDLRLSFSPTEDELVVAYPRNEVMFESVDLRLAGEVKIFRNISGTWTEQDDAAPTFPGFLIEENKEKAEFMKLEIGYFGHHVRFSPDGQILAITNHAHITDDKAEVLFYKKNADGKWTYMDGYYPQGIETSLVDEKAINFELTNNADAMVIGLNHQFYSLKMK
ncbi:YncE family protein [Algicola sagamiensis]|uniref:YncE family protein n=1 Tax=Algicola sagamiensis TaxID=163869 RepID=UPI000361001A|nr:beta-propeller fold lactonase family protein [Algicola sagamiensis]